MLRKQLKSGVTGDKSDNLQALIANKTCRHNNKFNINYYY